MTKQKDKDLSVNIYGMDRTHIRAYIDGNQVDKELETRVREDGKIFIDFLYLNGIGPPARNRVKGQQHSIEIRDDIEIIEGPYKCEFIYQDVNLDKQGNYVLTWIFNIL